MKICFENKSKDLGAEIAFADKSVLNIPPASQKEFEINEDVVTFSVKYVRDFTFGYQFIPKVDGKITDRLADKFAEKAVKSIGNAIVQVVNTYKISGLNDGSVIQVNDRAHYLSAEGIDAFFGCFPAIPFLLFLPAPFLLPAQPDSGRQRPIPPALPQVQKECGKGSCGRGLCL